MRGCISVHSIKYYNDYMNRLVEIRYHQLEDRLMFKNQIFEENKLSNDELNKASFNFAKNFVWKKYPKDGLKFVPVTDDDTSTYDTYLICFENNYNFSGFNNTAVCKVTKDNIEIPTEMKNKTPHWYMCIPKTSVQDLEKSLDVNDNDSIDCLVF